MTAESVHGERKTKHDSITRGRPGICRKSEAVAVSVAVRAGPHGGAPTQSSTRMAERARHGLVVGPLADQQTLQISDDTSRKPAQHERVRSLVRCDLAAPRQGPDEEGFGDPETNESPVQRPRAATDRDGWPQGTG